MTRRKRRRFRIALRLIFRAVQQQGSTSFLTPACDCGCMDRPFANNEWAGTWKAAMHGMAGGGHYSDVFGAAAALRNGTADRLWIGSTRRWWPPYGGCSDHCRCPRSGS